MPSSRCPISASRSLSRYPLFPSFLYFEQVVDLSSNQIAFLPPSMASAPALRSLDISCNPLIQIDSGTIRSVQVWRAKGRCFAAGVGGSR